MDDLLIITNALSLAGQSVFPTSFKTQARHLGLHDDFELYPFEGLLN